MTILEFIYKSLETNRMIRLLDLNPGTDEHHLSSSIIHASLDDPELRYIAMSYVWGKPVYEHRILLDGHILKITENLFKALRTLRRVLGPNKKIWADAICINQKNVPERNEQVLLMREIYQRAESVIAHFDFVAPGAELIPRTLEDFSLATHRLRKAVASIPPYIFRLSESQYREFNFPDPSGDELKTLINLLKHPWFQRSWTLQEVAVARNPSFVWQSTVDFKLLTSLILSTAHLQLRYNFDETASGRLNYLHFYSERSTARDISMLELLHECRIYEASDHKDKMYAFLSMSRDSGDVELAPNYHESLDDTLWRYAKYFVRIGYGLDMLYDCFAEDLQPNLPSWVPGCHSRLWKNANLVAPRSSSTAIDEEIMLNADGRVLIAKGFIFDSIKYADRVYDHSVLDKLALRHIIRMKSEIENYIVGKKSVYPTGETIEQAICRTLTVNESTEIYPTEEDRFINFCRVYGHILSRSNTEPVKVGLRSKVSTALKSRKEAKVSQSIESFDFEQEWKYAEPYLKAVVSSSTGRRRCVTSKGYLGQVLPAADVDDVIAFLIGGSIPFVLKPSGMLAGNIRSYKLIGQAYVHGVMNEELISRKGFHIENFHIV